MSFHPYYNQSCIRVKGRGRTLHSCLVQTLVVGWVQEVPFGLPPHSRWGQLPLISWEGHTVDVIVPASYGTTRDRSTSTFLGVSSFFSPQVLVCYSTIAGACFLFCWAGLSLSRLGKTFRAAVHRPGSQEDSRSRSYFLSYSPWWRCALRRLILRLDGARSREGGPIWSHALLSGHCVFTSPVLFLALHIEGTGSPAVVSCICWQPRFFIWVCQDEYSLPCAAYQFLSILLFFLCQAIDGGEVAVVTSLLLTIRLHLRTTPSLRRPLWSCKQAVFAFHSLKEECLVPRWPIWGPPRTTG